MTDPAIDEICRETRGQSHPPEAFLVSRENVVTQLLCVSIFFLEEGQQLPCPGPPLLGAAFGPGWGFTQAEVGRRADGSQEFRVPRAHFDDLDSGDLYGYRLCVTEVSEMSEIRRQLRRIRAQLAEQRGNNHKLKPKGNISTEYL